MKHLDKNVKSERGIVSIIALIICILFLIFAIYFTLDILGYIEVPEEYSFKQLVDKLTILYSDSNYDSNDELNNSSKDDSKVIKWKKVRKESYDDTEYTIELAGEVTKNTVEDVVEESDFDYNRFYYSQLTSDGKKIYDALLDNLDEIKAGKFTIDFGKEFNDLLNSENGEDILNDCFQAAVNGLLLDNPEIFYLDITKIYLLTQSTTYAFKGTVYEVKIGPKAGTQYFGEGFSVSNLKQAESEVKNTKKKVINSLKGTNREKIKRVHDYLVDNLEYDSDFSHPNIYNMYGALANKITVCEGYAKAFKSFMDELGIPCVVVCGNGKNSKGDIEKHAWNYVLIDNKWYAVDVTWDDPIVIGGGVASEENRYKYYLVGTNTLFKDHEEDNEIVSGVEFYYPSLNRTDCK